MFDWLFGKKEDDYVVTVPKLINGYPCIKTPAKYIIVGSMLSCGRRVCGIQIYPNLEQVHIQFKGLSVYDIVSTKSSVWVVAESAMHLVKRTEV